MDWPSKNVPQGGVFQHAKVNYSNETREFLKTLIEESKMTTVQRNRINYSLRSGDPLPPVDSDYGKTIRTKQNARFPVTIRPGSSKRRSQATIVQSGAYERDRFKPVHPRVDREVVKQELQDKMAHGKEMKPRPPRPMKKTKKKEKEEMNRYEEIKQEIKEREEWLKDMEQLGEAEKHRLVINQQIQQRLREMESLKPRDD